MNRSSSLEPKIETDCPECFGTTWVLELPFCKICGCQPNATGELFGYSEDHMQVLLKANGRVAWVDAGIAHDIQVLWENYIWTWVSCEGTSDTLFYRYVGLIYEKDISLAIKLLPWINDIDMENLWLTNMEG